MNHYLVMTIISSDHPGLVDKLATQILAHDGNWLESRMCKLGGQFAGILRAEVDVKQQPALLAALKSLEAEGITVIAHPEDNVISSPDHSQVGLELIGQDRPGIVSEITRVLSKHQVNVEELVTTRVSAPMSAEPLFQATATLHIPSSCNLDVLRSDLEKITGELMVDMIFGKPAHTIL